MIKGWEPYTGWNNMGSDLASLYHVFYIEEAWEVDFIFTKKSTRSIPFIDTIQKLINQINYSFAFISCDVSSSHLNRLLS